MRDIVNRFFESFGPKNDNNSKFDKVKLERMKLFKTSDTNRSSDGYIIIAPEKEQRIVSLKQKKDID